MQFFIQRGRDDLISFSIFCDQAASNPFRAYNPRPYHDLLAEKLMRVYTGEIKKLIISMPPQFGKSTATSINAMAWMLGKDPSLQIALASYGANLSEWFSQKCRDLMKTQEYQILFGNLIKEDSQAKNEWYTVKNGRYSAVWVGWPLTGKPVDILLIDDYLKDMQEAKSKVVKDGIWDWYNSVAVSRLHVNSRQIIIATRWAEDDLIGRVLETDPDGWEQLVIPCYDETWESIWPERFPRSLLEEKRKNDEFTFQSLYLCNPIPEWWVIFKRDQFSYYDLNEVWNWETYKKKYQVITFVDPAISEKQWADSTSIFTLLLDKDTNFIYELDIRHGKMLPDQIIDELFDVVRLRKPDRVWLETNQYQKMLELEIKKQMRIRDIFFTLEWQVSSGDKEAKIKSLLQPRYSNGSILHLRHGKHVQEYEAELLAFPNGKHDDIIDSAAMACKMLVERRQKDTWPKKDRYYVDPRTWQVRVQWSGSNVFKPDPILYPWQR